MKNVIIIIIQKSFQLSWNRRNYLGHLWMWLQILRHTTCDFSSEKNRHREIKLKKTKIESINNRYFFFFFSLWHFEKKLSLRAPFPCYLLVFWPLQTWVCMHTYRGTLGCTICRTGYFSLLCVLIIIYFIYRQCVQFIQFPIPHRMRALR